MAPMEKAEINEVEDQIKDTIQSLYQLMVQTTTYDAIPGAMRSRDVLIAELRTLSESLKAVNLSAADKADQLPSVPAELIQYVEAGRNPDIYTREFVELVRRGNQLMCGKMGAFTSFRDVLAEQMRLAMPELSDDVDRVVEATGGSVQSTASSTAAAGTGSAGQRTSTASMSGGTD